MTRVVVGWERCSHKFFGVGKVPTAFCTRNSTWRCEI